LNALRRLVCTRRCAFRVVWRLRERGRGRTSFSTKSAAFLAIALGLVVSSSGYAYENTLMAEQAKTSLVGMSELELETCLGLPDKEGTKGKTTLLSYNATSARTVNLSIPIVNGIGVSLAGYCRATFRLENGRVPGGQYRRQRSAGRPKQRLRRPDARLPPPA
jgi:hypothetical protein